MYAGYMLISGSDDKSLKVWDIRTCECVRAIGGHSDAISALKIYKVYNIFLHIVWV